MTVMPRLRPLGIGELLDAAIRVYRANFLKFTGIVALALIPTTILYVILTYYASSRWADLLQGFVQHLISAALTLAISRAYLREPISIAGAYRLSVGRYWSLFGASFIQGLAIGVPAAALALCLFSSAATGVIALIIILPPAAYLSTRWGLSTPAIVLERAGASAGLKRSWALTDGYFWRVFGVSVLAGILTLIVAELPGLAIEYGIEFLMSSELVVAVASTLTSQISLTLALPLSTAVTTLLYYDLRVRKEGYDLELMATAVAPQISRDASRTKAGGSLGGELGPRVD